MNSNNHILVADDHPLFREALTYIIKSAITDCEISIAVNYQQTRDLLAQGAYKLVFLDLNMPDSNGLSDLALIKKMHPQTPVVVVSASEDPNTIITCIDYNASGYIIKSSSPEEIKAAIQSILTGDMYVPPSINLDKQKLAEDANRQNIDNLTPAQLKVLIEIGKGKLNKQIAYDLGISEGTVKAHVTTIFKKLNINNRTQAGLLIKQQVATQA